MTKFDKIKGWYIIYHWTRDELDYNWNIIYCDNFRWWNNQDPYIWNRNFLYSFCHFQRLRNEVKNKDYVFFFVSSSNLAKINKNKELLLDTVLYSSEVKEWDYRNKSLRKDSIYLKISNENREICFRNHFSWVRQHYIKSLNKKRQTIFWDKDLSFIITKKDNNRINIHRLVKNSILRYESKSGKKYDNKLQGWFFSQPLFLDRDDTIKLYEKLYNFSNDKDYIIFKGKELENIYNNNYGKLKLLN